MKLLVTLRLREPIGPAHEPLVQELLDALPGDWTATSRLNADDAPSAVGLHPRRLWLSLTTEQLTPLEATGAVALVVDQAHDAKIAVASWVADYDDPDRSVRGDRDE